MPPEKQAVITRILTAEEHWGVYTQWPAPIFASLPDLIPLLFTVEIYEYGLQHRVY